MYGPKHKSKIFFVNVKIRVAADRISSLRSDNLVKDPNLISALTGHVEGSRAFNRYRTIDIEMKKDWVKMLEGIKYHRLYNLEKGWFGIVKH